MFDTLGAAFKIETDFVKVRRANVKAALFVMVEKEIAVQNR